MWLRAVIGFLFMPFLVDTNLGGNVWDWATAQPANADPATSHDTQGTDNAQRDLLTETFGSAIPMPGVKDLASETLQSDVGEQAHDDTEQDDEELFLNRAERRAQQREDSATSVRAASSRPSSTSPARALRAGLRCVKRPGETHVDRHLCRRSCSGGCCGLRANPEEKSGGQHRQPPGCS